LENTKPGINPKKLLNIIFENNEIKIKDLPLLIFLYPIKVLNCIVMLTKKKQSLTVV
jgi:hypothetical protein